LPSRNWYFASTFTVRTSNAHPMNGRVYVPTSRPRTPCTPYSSFQMPARTWPDGVLYAVSSVMRSSARAGTAASTTSATMTALIADTPG
jgi:hypothetical protein